MCGKTSNFNNIKKWLPTTKFFCPTCYCNKWDKRFVLRGIYKKHLIYLVVAVFDASKCFLMVINLLLLSNFIVTLSCFIFYTAEAFLAACS